MLDPAYAVMIAIVVAEVAVSIAVMLKPGTAERLRKRGVNVMPLMILVDMGKVPRFKRLSESRVFRVGVLIAGLVNFAAVLALFYWQVLPAICHIISSLFIRGAAQASSPFVPIIPGVTIGLRSFLYILLALSIGVAAHELMHAIVAYAEGWRVEAWGVGLFIIFPLAYVRPSEEDFEKASLKAKAAVLTAGVLVNTVLFLIAMGLMPVVSAQITTELTIVSLVNNPEAPAVRAGLPAPSIIVSINGTRIDSIQMLQQFLAPIYPRNATLVFEVVRAEVIGGEIVKPVENHTEVFVIHKPANEKIGIYIADLPSWKTPASALYSARFLFWLSIVNISLSMINAAPLYISDGGRLVSEALKGRAPSWVNHLIQGGTVVATVVLLVIGFLNFLH